MPITALFAAILALIFFYHSLRTINGRRETKTNLGTGDSDVMLRRVRIHGNFAEYIPFLLIILGLLEQAALPSWFLYTFGGVVVIGRLLHAYGLWSPATPGWARTWGMQLTLWPLIIGAFTLLYSYFVSILG